MRSALLAPLGSLLAGAGLALAQGPTTPTPAVPAAPPLIVQAPGDTPKSLDTKAGEGQKPATTTKVVEGEKLPIIMGPGGGPPSPQVPMSLGHFDGDVDSERDFDFWVGGEYVHWYSKKGPTSAPIFTTGPNGTFGVLGQPGVGPVSGLGEFDFGDQSGARASVGAGMPGLGAGVELSGFILGKRTTNFGIRSDANGAPTYARPVIDNNSGLETSSLISTPDAFRGSADVEATTQLWGAELNVVRGRFASQHLFADWIFGFRYMTLEEGLAISQRSQLLPGGTSGFNGDVVNAPSILTISDEFRTRNNFYGGQIGVQGELQYCGLFIHALSKIAVGANNQTVHIAGQSTRTDQGAPTQGVPGGLLALASNSGDFNRNVFTYIPEVNVNVGYQFGKHVRAFVGYTFIYWDDVLRPGAQIDRRVNPTQIPTSLAFGPIAGAPAPVQAAQSSSYWVQGFNVGMSFRY